MGLLNRKRYTPGNIALIVVNLGLIHAEFWEAHFHCRYNNSPPTPHNQQWSQPCAPDLRLNKNNTDFEDQLQFVSDAVMAFAHALK